MYGVIFAQNDQKNEIGLIYTVSIQQIQYISRLSQLFGHFGQKKNTYVPAPYGNGLVL